MSGWQRSACILCSINCGIEVQLDGRRLARIRGDKAHPTSQGYTCEKPARLDHYQNGRHRLTSPLRRLRSGSFEPIDWDSAIREVAAGFTGVRDTWGGGALFEAILRERSGVVFSDDEPSASWSRIAHDDGRIHLAIPELLAELRALRGESRAAGDPAFPFVLAAGERRTSTANTIYRDPAWRRKDADGSLRMNPEDAARLGIADGGRARITTKRGSAVTWVELTDTLQPGHVTLPNGLGVDYPDEDGRETVHGVPPNELTASEDRDWVAGTPWHKHVRARVEAVA